jgi:hypothetical protein
VGDVPFPTGKKVIETDDFVSFVEEAFAKVGTEETRPPVIRMRMGRKPAAPATEIKT